VVDAKPGERSDTERATRLMTVHCARNGRRGAQHVAAVRSRCARPRRLRHIELNSCGRRELAIGVAGAAAMEEVGENN